MFIGGLVIWVLSVTAWSYMMICPETRGSGATWIPIITMWIGNTLMFADRK